MNDYALGNGLMDTADRKGLGQKSNKTAPFYTSWGNNRAMVPGNKNGGAKAKKSRSR